jgi:hypothetical protein
MNLSHDPKVGKPIGCIAQFYTSPNGAGIECPWGLRSVISESSPWQWEWESRIALSATAGSPACVSVRCH